MAEETTVAKSEVDEKTLAFLAYVFLGLSGIIVFLIGKTKLSKFHGMQSLILSIVVFAVNLVLSFIAGLFSGPQTWGLGLMIWNITTLMWGLTWLYAIFIGLTKAYKGEMYKMPYIGNYAEEYSK